MVLDFSICILNSVLDDFNAGKEVKLPVLMKKNKVRNGDVVRWTHQRDKGKAQITSVNQEKESHVYIVGLKKIY